MRRAALLLAFVATSALAQDERPEWSRDVACPTARKVAGEPKLIDIDGWEHCSSLDVGKELRVLKCVREEAEGLFSEMRLERRGRVVDRRETGAYLGETGMFEAWWVDLDEKVGDELIVFDYLGAGVGMAPWVYDAVVLREGRGEAAAALEFHDIEGLHPFVAPAGGGPCRLLAARHGRFEDRDGTWTVGRWYRWSQGAWIADETRPTVARRWYHRFLHAQGDASSGRRGRLLWHRSRDTIEVASSVFDEGVSSVPPR